MKTALVLLALIALRADREESPPSIVVATSRGEAVITVHRHQSTPSLSVTDLATLLPISEPELDGDWTRLRFADQPFGFLAGAPVMEFRDRLFQLVHPAYESRGDFFVPLQWLVNYIPRVFSEGYSYDPVGHRFVENSVAPVITSVSGSPPGGGLSRPEWLDNRPNEFGLRKRHVVVVDPGHGGVEPGNPGRYLPAGVHEKHITLAIGFALRDELERRGIDVWMTRAGDSNTTDAYRTRRQRGWEYVEAQRHELNARAAVCTGECSLFASIHVDALPRTSRNYTQANGIHTYVFGQSRSDNARRVAALENGDLRVPVSDDDDALSYILKDLQLSENDREAMELARLVQSKAAAVHPGRDRGVEQAAFAVLRYARRPAILIETGFATNRGDARFLSSTEGQRALATSIADGIVEYLRRYEARLAAAYVR